MQRNATTSLETYSMPYGPVETCLVASLLVALVVVTLVGNALVAAAVFSVRKLRHPPNFLLVSLALADFCVGILVLPLSGTQLITGYWPLGTKFCQVWASTDVFLCTASILNLCAVSVDRYFAITDPLKYGSKRTTKRILCYILMVWVLAFFISVVPVFTLPPVVSNSTAVACEPNQNIGYQIYATMGAFYIPVAIMLIVNYKIYKAAKRMAVKERFSQERSNSEQYSSISGGTKLQKQNSSRMVIFTQTPSRLSLVQRFVQKTSKYLPEPFANNRVGESRAAKTLSIIMGVFVICWLPFFIIALIKPIVITVNPSLKSVVPIWLDMFVLWLGYINSAINPGLYAVFNRDFRVPFKEILCCRCSNVQNVMRSETFMETYGGPRLLSPESADTSGNGGSRQRINSENSKI